MQSDTGPCLVGVGRRARSADAGRRPRFDGSSGRAAAAQSPTRHAVPRGQVRPSWLRTIALGRPAVDRRGERRRSRGDRQGIAGAARDALRTQLRRQCRSRSRWPVVPSWSRRWSLYETPLSWFDWWPGDSAGGAAMAVDDPGDAAEAFMRRLVGDEVWERLPAAKREERRAEGASMVSELADLRRSPPWEADAVTAPVLALYGEHARAPPLRRDASTRRDAARLSQRDGRRCRSRRAAHRRRRGGDLRGRLRQIVVDAIGATLGPIRRLSTNESDGGDR